MEIISEVIFAVSSASAMNDPPEEKLVSKLIETVLPSTGPTQEVSALKDNLPDTIPVIRSYVLQILLEYKYVDWFYVSTCNFHIKTSLNCCNNKFKPKILCAHLPSSQTVKRVGLQG